MTGETATTFFPALPTEKALPTLASIKSARTSILADNAEKIPSRREEARGPAVIPRNIRGTANLRARKAMKPEIASEEKIKPPKKIRNTKQGLQSDANNYESTH